MRAKKKVHNIRILKRIFTRVYLVCLLLPFFQPLSAAQKQIEPQLHLSNYSIDDGLSLNSVTSFAQSRDGFVWIGTEDGLNRFDGYEFLTIKRKIGSLNSLADSQINALLIGSKDKLWIGTEKGLVVRDIDGNFSNIVVKDSSKPGSVTELIEDIYGQIWVIRNAMLYLYQEDKRQLVPYHHIVQVKTPLLSQPIKGLYSVGSTLFYGSSDCLFSVDLISLNEQKRCFSDLNDEESLFVIQAIHSNNEDSLWIGSSKGVIYLNLLSGKTRHYSSRSKPDHQISHDRVQDIFVDSSNRVWVATMNGLNLYDATTDRFTVYKQNLINKSGLLSNDITQIFEDNNGLIWIATYDAGFHIWNPKTELFNHYLTRSEASEFRSTNTVHSVTSDLLGNIWIGTYGSGIFRVDSSRSSLTHVRSSNLSINLSSKLVTSLHFDIYDNLWIGSFDGLMIFDPDSNYVLPIEHRLFNNYITTISEDHRGDIWIGGGGSLARVDGVSGDLSKCQSPKVTDYSERLANIINSDDFVINSVYEDVDGLLWVGTDQGLAAFNPDSDIEALFLSDENNPKSISNNFIQVIYEDTHGTLWIGTGDGLNKLMSQTDDLQNSYFIRFTEEQGLVSDSIYGIQSGNDDSLWLSSSFGLLMFNTSTNQVKHFNAKDGLQSNEFNIWAHHKSSDNEIMFGGVNGLTTFYPDMLTKDEQNYPLKIIDISINNEAHFISPDASPFIILDEKSDFLSIKVAAINFHDSEDQRYRYRLVGLNEDWIELGNARNINLFGLNSGQYNLEIQSRKRSEEWSDEKLTVLLEVKANFWDSKLAFMGYLTLILLSILAAIYFWLKRVNQKTALVRKELESNREYIKKILMDLESEKTRADLSEQEVSTLKERAMFYDKKLKEFNKKDKLTNFYLKRYFEAIINNEDAFFRSNQMEFPDGSLIALSVSNYEQLLKQEFKANVEAAISDFSDLIKEYVTGDDLISRWDENSFIMLESGTTEENMRKLYDFYRLISNRQYNCGNDRLLNLDFIVTQIPTPVSKHKSNFLNRTALAYLSADLIGYLIRKGRRGAYLFQCVKDIHPTELNKMITQGVEFLIKESYFELVNLEEHFSREKL